MNDETITYHSGARPGDTCFADIVAVDGETAGAAEGLSRFYFGSSAHALGGHHPDLINCFTLL
jgi:hypothetical protein